MSLEAHDLVNQEWTRWQGHLVNGEFPLGRCLGCSEHGGVFLTKWEGSPGREVAIKLLPASRAHEDLQIPRWAKASALAHPHLLPLLKWGACQLDGLPYVYVVMEYADQTLAQVLLQRALSTAEAREMLSPLLEALAFLHRQNFIQGQLKPTNILVVGDQLKLASDTIRHTGDDPLNPSAMSAYDPPEGPAASHSTGSDMWALGVSLVAALTRRSASSAAGYRNLLPLPAEFPSEFRDLVSRCLSDKAQNRPTVAEALAWTQGKALKPVPELPPPVMIERPALKTHKPAPPLPSTRSSNKARTAPANIAKPRKLAAAALIGAVVLILGWAGIKSLTGHRPTETPSAPPELAAQTAAPPAPTPPPAAPSAAARSDSVLHTMIPSVPASAARTIRGHVKVSVRTIVGPDGSVTAAIADRGGPSRYFERLAVEAAKKWAFAPAHAASPRVMQIQFDFARDGTTAHATPVH